jgi:hypothetical protein
MAYMLKYPIAASTQWGNKLHEEADTLASALHHAQFSAI